MRCPKSKLKIWEHSCWPAAKSGQTLLVNSLLREDHFLLQATFGLRCPPLLEWSCCFFIVSKLFKCRHWKQFFFTLSWGEIAYIWPKEVFLLSFNFRAVYIDLKLKEMIFRITTVSVLAPLLEKRRRFDIVTPDFLSFSIFCPFTLSR